jgi:RNA polymerase sigma factor (sigma-70 family)
MSLPRLDARALHEGCLSVDEHKRSAAFEQLGGLLHRIALARLRARPQLAEECAQEAMVTIWRRLSAGRGPREPERFVSWSARIVVNKALDEIRKREPSPQVHRSKRVAQSRQTSLDAPRLDGERTLGELLPDAEALDAEERAAYLDVRRTLTRLAEVEGVSERSRVVLARGFLEGVEDEELADLLGTTRANVHVIRCRDLAKLREDESFLAQLSELYDG